MREVIKALAANNKPALSFASELNENGDIAEMTSSDELYQYILNNPNRTQIGKAFYHNPRKTSFSNLKFHFSQNFQEFSYLSWRYFGGRTSY